MRSALSWPADELGDFFNQSGVLLCVTGQDGTFKRLNPMWTACLGWTAEELKSRPPLSFVHPDDREPTRAEFERLSEDGGESIGFENRYRCRDGSYRWLQWTARTIPGHDQVYASALDISRLKWLEREILEIGDREKARVARDLHDGLCQNLSGIAALSATLSKKLAADGADGASAAAAEITMLVNDTLGEARDLARGLDPAAMVVTELADALENLARATEHRFGIPCTFSCDRPAAGVRQDVKMHLLSIAREAVQNAVAHARATRIDICLGGTHAKGRLRICDDGVGVSETGRGRDGIGLYTMTFRARLIGGSLAVAGRDPKGTAVTCTFPHRQPSDTPTAEDDARPNT